MLLKGLIEPPGSVTTRRSQVRWSKSWYPFFQAPKELGIMEVKKQHKYGRIDLDAHGDGIRFSMPFPSFRNHFENLRLKRNSKNPCSQKTTVSHNLFLVGGIPTPLKKYESQLR